MIVDIFLLRLGVILMKTGSLFTLLLLAHPFFLPCLGVVSTKTDSYIPSHGTIEFFASHQPVFTHSYAEAGHKNNVGWGVAQTHIKRPYERYNRPTQKKCAKKKSNKNAQKKQEDQYRQQSYYVKTTADREQVQRQQYQQLCKQIESNFKGQYHEFKQYCEHEYGDCSEELYTILNKNGRLEKRFAALQNIEHAGAHYAHYDHLLTQEAVSTLKALGYDVESYKFCYGNQIQQVIHEDCIALLQETSTIPISSIMYSRAHAITDCIDAARVYNQAADCIKACTIQDFCWSLLEYGKAVAEGAVWGAVGAVQDCLQHPLHTAACVIIPEGVLVYQLSKVLVNVADIGATYLFDKEKGKRKLHDYIAPLTQIIHALQNKQLSGPEIVRGTTQLAIHWKAQSKLLSGLSKLYSTSKIKVEQFIKENPFAAPEQYMTMPEGMLLKCTIKGANSENNAAKILKKYSRKYWIKKHQLPTKGRIRYVPPKDWVPSQDLPFKRLSHGTMGYVDRFGNIWVKGKSRTAGEAFEWDVQLSAQGKQQIGWTTRDNSHANVSLNGRITHK